MALFPYKSPSILGGESWFKSFYETSDNTAKEAPFNFLLVQNDTAVDIEVYINGKSHGIVKTGFSQAFINIECWEFTIKNLGTTLILAEKVIVTLGNKGSIISGGASGGNQKFFLAEILLQFPQGDTLNTPLFVSFQARFIGGVAPFTCLWDFGDGSSTSNEEAPAHIYDTVGNYTVTLTAYDSDGTKATCSVTIRVQSWFICAGIVLEDKVPKTTIQILEGVSNEFTESIPKPQDSITASNP